MPLKPVAWAVAAVFLAAMLWRYGPSALRIAKPQDTTPPKKIEFDNGTVRTYAPAASEAQIPARPQATNGSLRKCIAGASVTYTNTPCPPKSREAPIKNGTVNVVTGARDAKDSPPGEPNPTDRLREKMIERAVGP